MEPEELGWIIRKRRQQLAMSQEEVANCTGYAPNYIYAIEKGKLVPCKDTIEAIAEALFLEAVFLTPKVEDDYLADISLSKKIRLYRKKEKLTQIALSKKAGLGNSRVSDIELEISKNPSYNSIYAIAEVLNLNPITITPK